MTSTATGVASPTVAQKIGLWFAHVYVLGMCGVLLGGFIVQFGESEYPCPLCLIQRMFMMLTALGPAYFIARSRSGPVSTRDFATGYGMSIIAALAGAAVSARQILLHILPGDPGYGGKVLGLSLYTWALITFLLAALTSAANLLLITEFEPGASRSRLLSTITLSVLAVVVLANLLASCALQGFHWFLPDDPTRYQLFHDLGLTP
ncbi:disulfide bond formation protein B [Amycolatopsis sp. cmx-11-12]|uniref:disulfide bond formation protein B n=1 Tax=Amycolatopsis sp. cmx-11-12 TaxID=2785795 RepID=UPI003917E0C6